MWNAIRADSKEKRWDNFQKSLKVLDDAGIVYRIADEVTGHIKIGDWSFWPTTGKYYHQRKKWRGRGVFNLLKNLQCKTCEMKDGRMHTCSIYR